MRLSKIIEILENKAIAFYKKNKDSIPRYILILFIILYAAGFVVHSVTTGLHNFYSGESARLFTVSITKNISSLFTPAGIGTVLFGFLMFLLFSGKGKDLLSGYKTVKDKERVARLQVISAQPIEVDVNNTDYSFKLMYDTNKY